jgi:lipopolysaccharide/colanic/teichoic acid biosynthesis glycosyltransferase
LRHDSDGTFQGEVWPAQGTRPLRGVRGVSWDEMASHVLKRVVDLRVLDLAVALPLLILLFPLIVLVAAAIKLESRGPVFYRCRRVGRGGFDFWMIKFRKMRNGARGLALTAVEDERFTRLGPFLARTKLDELPQLWNVVKGQMSLVGPRPEDPSFVELHSDDYTEILRVAPGITGLSQLAFARESEILDPDDRVGDYLRRILPQKIEMDRLYAQQRSWRMDGQILFWTAAAVVLRRQVAVHRDTGRMNLRAPREAVHPVAVESQQLS